PQQDAWPPTSSSKPAGAPIPAPVPAPSATALPTQLDGRNPSTPQILRRPQPQPQPQPHSHSLSSQQSIGHAPHAPHAVPATDMSYFPVTASPQAIQTLNTQPNPPTGPPAATTSPSHTATNILSLDRRQSQAPDQKQVLLSLFGKGPGKGPGSMLKTEGVMAAAAQPSAKTPTTMG